MAIIAALSCTGCRKRSDAPLPYAQVSIRLVHEVDDQPLVFDTLLYRNKAGDIYSLSRLQYYLSNIRLYRNRQLVYAADTVVYIDASGSPAPVLLRHVPAGSFDSLACFIGVDPLHNIHGKLPATAEHIAMEWPDVMGGGYHFIKLEGHWKDAGFTPGFAVHLGTDPYIVAAGCKANGTIIAGRENRITLCMNISEWFENPHTYSFPGDGVYTMGDTVLMRQISENGRDVLRIKP